MHLNGLPKGLVAHIELRTREIRFNSGSSAGLQLPDPATRSLAPDSGGMPPGHPTRLNHESSGQLSPAAIVHRLSLEQSDVGTREIDGDGDFVGRNADIDPLGKFCV